MIYLLITIVSAIICYSDFKYRKISNKAILCVFLLSSSLSIKYGFFIQSIKISFLIFVIGFFLTKIKIIGGGDIKLISTLSLAIHGDVIWLFFIMIGFFGGVQLSMEYLYCIIKNKKTPFDKGVPYGIAISLSGLLAIFLSIILS